MIVTIIQMNSQELKKTEDWNKAMEIAKKENKNILIVLTASEWCRPCIKMKKKVFSETEFINYTNKNLVLYIIELPGGTLRLDGPEYLNYKKFERKYNSNSLPSLILTDSDGNKIRNLKGRMTSLKNVLKELKKSPE